MSWWAVGVAGRIEGWVGGWLRGLMAVWIVVKVGGWVISSTVSVPVSTCRLPRGALQTHLVSHPPLLARSVNKLSLP